MPEHMDTKFNVREFAAMERYVNDKENAQQKLAQLQAQALQGGPHGA